MWQGCSVDQFGDITEANISNACTSWIEWKGEKIILTVCVGMDPFLPLYFMNCCALLQYHHHQTYLSFYKLYSNPHTQRVLEMETDAAG